jgi:superfamily II DNA or RNA helicase
MAAEGFDCQALDTLIMATPKREIEQCTGRIMRKKKNDRVHTPLIIDIADEFSNFKAWTQKRIKFYKDKNYKIQEYEVNDSNQVQLTTLKRDWPWEPKTSAPESVSSSSEASPSHHSEQTAPVTTPQTSSHVPVTIMIEEIDLS